MTSIAQKYDKNLESGVDFTDLVCKKCDDSSPFFAHKNVALYENSVLKTSLLAPQSVDLIITSPPYNVGIEYNSNDDTHEYESYLKFCEKWLKNCYLWAKEWSEILPKYPA